MAAVNKIDSNITGLAYAEEASLKTLPVTPVWIPLEPNSYEDFGAQLTTIARNPINSSRQRKKGLPVDIDASGGINMDLTQTNMQHILQGFFFADFRTKGEAKNAIGVSTLLFAASNSDSRITRSGSPSVDLTDLFEVGDLVFIQGFNNDDNNGLFEIDAVTASTADLNLADGSGTAATLVDESANSNVSIIKVGAQATSGDINVDVSGTRPALTSTTFDFRTLGVVPGEWVYIGGDDADTRFANDGNNGFARVRVVEENRLELDKTQGTMIGETGTSLLIHIYVGRTLKNETGALIKRRSYQLERQLGAPDDAQPGQVQAEYLPGAIANELTLNLTQADKFNADLSFVALDWEPRDATTGVKSGTRVPLVESDGFNTTSDVTRFKLATFAEGSTNPAPLFAFATDLTLSINNNVTPNKAIGVFGGFDATAGTFTVSGNITAYFADLAAVEAVRDNADITLDLHAVKHNAGFSIDLPLLTLGDGRPTVEQDQPIMLPLSLDAATAAKIDPNMNHTLLITFWDYLPDRAA